MEINYKFYFAFFLVCSYVQKGITQDIQFDWKTEKYDYGYLDQEEIVKYLKNENELLREKIEALRRQNDLLESKLQDKDANLEVSIKSSKVDENPLTATYHLFFNTVIEICRRWELLSDDDLPPFIPRPLIRAWAKKKKSYEK